MQQPLLKEKDQEVEDSIGFLETETSVMTEPTTLKTNNIEDHFVRLMFCVDVKYHLTIRYHVANS